MASLVSLPRFLRRVRRRRLLQLVCEETLTAVILALIGFVAVLIAGTRILDWYWPAGMFVAGLCVALYRLRRRVVGDYRLLQLIDRRLDLSDTLSTAYYFGSDPPPGNVAANIRDRQRIYAESLCSEADVRRALPFPFPRRAWAALVVALVAIGTFGLRYGILRTLDLSPPIAQSLFEFYRPTTLASMLTPAQSPPPGLDTPEGAAYENRLSEDVEQPTNSDLPPSETTNTDPMPPGLEGMAAGDELYDPSTDSAESAGNEWSDSGIGDRAEGEESERVEAGEADERPDFRQSDNPGLFEKLQDAFANLMTTLRAPEAATDRLAPDPEEAPQQPEDEEENGNRQLATSTQPGSIPIQSPGSERSEQVDIAPEDTVEADIPGGGQNIAGSSEGSKEIKMAEQLEAMGKLSEIIGQRAENLTGDMMVEISSGDQELETAYTDSSASHHSTGGGIHRDEVPLDLRDYIQAYFDEVHRQPGPGE